MSPRNPHPPPTKRQASFRTPASRLHGGACSKTVLVTSSLLKHKVTSLLCFGQFNTNVICKQLSLLFYFIKSSWLQRFHQLHPSISPCRHSHRWKDFAAWKQLWQKGMKIRFPFLFLFFFFFLRTTKSAGLLKSAFLPDDRLWARYEFGVLWLCSRGVCCDAERKIKESDSRLRDKVRIVRCKWSVWLEVLIKLPFLKCDAR